MWRWLIVGVLSAVSFFSCSFDSTPKRLAAYLPQSFGQTRGVAKTAFPAEGVTAIMAVLNDSGFKKSAPKLHRGTLEKLGSDLNAKIQEQVPIELNAVVYPEGLKPNGSADQFIQLAKEQNVPYLLLAVLSSSEWEVFAHFQLDGDQEGAGAEIPGYRVENYARVELALLDAQTGQTVVSTDGQAWAYLERLVVPIESNVYPVVRRAQTQPPIYPNTESEKYETLRLVSGLDAIAEAVMHLAERWKKNQPT